MMSAKARKLTAYISENKVKVLLVAFLFVVAAGLGFAVVRQYRTEDSGSPEQTAMAERIVFTEDSALLDAENQAYKRYSNEHVNISISIPQAWDVSESEVADGIPQVDITEGDSTVMTIVPYLGGRAFCEHNELESAAAYSLDSENTEINGASEVLSLCKSGESIVEYVLVIENTKVNEWLGVEFYGSEVEDLGMLLSVLGSVSYEEDEQYAKGYSFENGETGDGSEDANNDDGSDAVVPRAGQIISEITINDVFTFPWFFRSTDAEEYVASGKVRKMYVVGQMYIDMDVKCGPESVCSQNLLESTWVQYYSINNEGQKRDIEKMPLQTVDGKNGEKYSLLYSLDARGEIFDDSNEEGDWVDVYIEYGDVIDQKLTRIYYTPHKPYPRDVVTDKNYINVTSLWDRKDKSYGYRVPKMSFVFRDESGNVLYEGETDKYGHLTFSYDYIEEELEYHDIIVEVNIDEDLSGYNVYFNWAEKIDDNTYRTVNWDGGVRDLSVYITYN